MALGWHLGIIGIGSFIKSRREKPSLKRLLRLIEIDLLRTLHESLEKLPQKKLEKTSHQAWLKEVEQRLEEIRWYNEKSD